MQNMKKRGNSKVVLTGFSEQHTKRDQSGDNGILVTQEQSYAMEMYLQSSNKGLINITV